MKKNTFLFLSLMLFIGLQLSYSQAPDWSRVLQFSTFGLQYGRVVTADSGNVYMAGSISGQITFDGTNFTSVGNRDMIIVKLSNTGVTAWKKQINAQVNGILTANAIKVDAEQNLYVSGTFTGTTTIGSSTITSGTLYNAFMAKFDLNGNGLWATAYLATGTGSSKIALDDNDNCYLISSSSKLLKFDNSGVKQWEQSYTNKTLQAIAVYDSNLYVGGDLQEGTTTFGSITLTSLGGKYTGYLVKADLNGVYNDSLVVGGSTSGYGSTVCDIAIYNSGDLIITGGYTQDLILGNDTVTNPSMSYYTYIAKCNTDFAFEWVKSSTSNTNAMFNYRLFIDNSNNIYEYGLCYSCFMYDTITICPSLGQFLVQFDANGVATNSYNLQKRSSYDRTIVTPEGKIVSTGSYYYSGDTFYGNLFVNQYDGENLEWRKISTNTQSGTAKVNYVKHDSSGNTYIQSRVTGYCNYFGTIINNNSSVTVIAKHDITGNLLWLNQIVDLRTHSLNDASFGPGFTIDKDNNILTIGRFETSLNIGNQTFINQNTFNDGYVAKYSSTGQFAWAVQLNADGWQCTLDGITADSEGNVIVSGSFTSEMTISGNTISAGTDDGVFIIKFDANGNYLWAHGFPIGELVYLAMVSTDENNNIYLAGEMYNYTTNLLTFGAVSIPQTNEDGGTVLVKFDTDGNPQWANTYGGVVGASYADGWPVDIKTDSTGNTYLWGWCRNNAVFGTTTLTNPFTNDLKYSYYLTKINTTGDVVWANAIYESYDDNKWGFNYGDLLDLDKTGNIYVGGHFKDSISIAGTIYEPEGLNDFFVAQYSNNGGFQWIKTIPSDGPHFGNIHAISVFNDNVLTLGGSAGKDSTLGNFDITKKGGSSCIIATLGNLPFLTVSTDTLSIAAAASSTATFDISSNISWTAESNQSWLTVSSSAGSDDETITLTATANPTTSSRTATVTVSENRVPPQTIIVTQDSAAPVLTVSANNLIIAAADSSTVTFDISSNISWTTESNQSWLTVSSSAGSGNETITLTATANPTISSRTANVTVSGNGVNTQTIIVTQDGAAPVLTVSTNTLTIAAADSSIVTFDIVSNISWIVLSDQSWLIVSNSAGSNNATITLTAIFNPTISSRTATVTVYGTGVTEQIITVVQDGAEPVLMVSTNTLTIAAADSITATFDITSNLSWTAESNQSWLTVSNNAGFGNETIMLTATTNPTIISRTATVTVSGTGVTEQIIIVVQDGAIPVLMVSTDSLTIVAADSSTVTFDITTNINWIAISNKSWLTVSSSAGSGDETITLTATLNPTISSRTATVTVYGTGVTEQIITIVQDPAIPVLTVSTNTLTIAAANNSTATFEISSNISWTAISNQSWLTISSSAGSGDEAITLTATANPTTSLRTATITISGNGVISQIITVVQDAAIPVLMVSTDSLTIAATDSSTAAFDITSNINWIILSNQSWLTVSSSAGFGNETIALTTAINPDTSSRTATITVYGTGVTEQIITVVQDSAIPVLTVSTNTLTIAAADSTTATFEISSNISWATESNQIWLTVSSSAGSGNETIALTATINPDTSSRTATITVSGTGVTERTVTVTQMGIITTINEIINNHNVNLYPNPNNGKFNLYLDNFIHDDILNITIINSLGIVIKKFKITKIPTKYTQEIDLGNLVKGLYFMTLQTNQTWGVKSFVVQ